MIRNRSGRWADCRSLSRHELPGSSITEADRLARDLARLTGESLTQAVTVALEERLERERAKGASGAGLAERLEKVLVEMHPHYRRRPVTKEEWDRLWDHDER